VHKKKKDNVIISTENVVPHEGRAATLVKSKNVVECKVPPIGSVKVSLPGLTKQSSHTNAVNGKYCNCVYMHVDVTVFVHLVCINCASF